MLRLFLIYVVELLQLPMNPGFVPPHLSLEFLAKAGMFHPHLPNLAGKLSIVIFKLKFINILCIL